EHALLHVGAVDSDRPSAELVAVQHQIVGLSTDTAWLGLEPVEVLVPRSGERVMNGRPALLFLVPLEKWEIGYPHESPAPAIDYPELISEMKAKLPGHFRGNFFLVGNEEEKISDRQSCRLGGLSLLLLSQELCDRRLPAVGIDADPHQTL